MGRALAEAVPAARLVFEEVDDALDENLSRLIFEGDEADLTLTENAQPALMAVSLAVARALEGEGGIRLADVSAYVAGHSLGEYSALCAAGALDLAETARLLKRRGQAMQRAVPPGEGAMAALIGVAREGAETIATVASEAGVCVVANDNAPGQVVVSGARAAVERAVAIAPDHGARRAMLLPVSAPFHCPLMAPAAEAMAEALADAPIAPPTVPLVANVTAEPVSEPETIRILLVEQVTAVVRWRDSIVYMRDHGVETVIELGAGRVLAGLAKRIDRAIDTCSVATPDELEALLKAL